ncbi:MAG: hypothetical protein QOI95_311 [Acidimicrobiaceae bacterium]|jgi:demethylmacrocin O-methyltransferase
MWRSFFPYAEIIGVDLYEKRLPAEDRISMLVGDQGDRNFLERLGAERGPFGLVIDDGSHRGDHINLTFETLWPHVGPGGLYVIEDLVTAYEPDYGGGPPGATGTSMSLIKALVDGVQHQSDVKPCAVHVYPNIVFIEMPPGKGEVR